MPTPNPRLIETLATGVARAKGAAKRWLGKRQGGAIGLLTRQAKRFLRPKVPDFGEETLMRDARAIARFHQQGSIPWSPGYVEYKNRFISEALADRELLETFRQGRPLPPGYGWRLDERVVEYPWTVAQLRDGGPRLLDAGSTLNHNYVLGHEVFRWREILIYTLAAEGTSAWPNVRYEFGDLRATKLSDASLDVVTCLSTLEHIGMDNTLLYTSDATFRECDLASYRQAVREFHRVLVPGGLALITVPFGLHENHGWTQQFDRAGVDDIIQTFGGRLESLDFFRYRSDGWAKATAQECADCRYFNIHAGRGFDADHAAAARAVACLRLVRE